MNNDKQITNGGVKFVRVQQVGETLSVRIVDNEGLGELLDTIFIPNDRTRPIPTQVEAMMLDRFIMGPSWFWSDRGYGNWEGNFAYLTNYKVSDAYRWSEILKF
jgi:hypothetical protein